MSAQERSNGTAPSGENVLEIDPAALAAEAEAALASAPPSAQDAVPPLASGDDDQAAAAAPGEPTMAELQAIAAQSAAGLVFLVDRAAAITVPNWGITPAESKELGDAAAVALAAWFPDGVIPIKYVVLLNLAGTAYAIAERRRDPVTGAYPPRKLSPMEARTDGAAAAA